MMFALVGSILKGFVMDRVIWKLDPPLVGAKQVQ